ncbi:hypothetical protein RHMOL_Rhmol06G0074400 [Rhododendron molle]|uniref:Uncharacterized protein n=1 Tax=Rhododendron molle TaxID=49168 RepID=A0ACC0N9Q1_RHOML|nr:hypothetical protein RHMOL_Rhmol06G0074400 [Rhododendron molle]
MFSENMASNFERYPLLAQLVVYQHLRFERLWIGADGIALIDSPCSNLNPRLNFQEIPEREMKEKSGEVTPPQYDDREVVASYGTAVTCGERDEITEVGEGSEGLTEKKKERAKETGTRRRTGDFNTAPTVTTTWMNSWACFCWLVVFLRRHRVRPTVAMAYGVEAILLWLAIQEQHQLQNMNSWACFCWLVVFLRRHRVRPTVAMAYGVEAILLWLAIQEQHQLQNVSEDYPSDLDFIKALQIISIGLTIYNALFTLGDWIGYRHSHPHLAAFHLALLVLALTHFVVATIHLVLRSRIFPPHYMETLVSGVGVVVAFIELYGADAYFAAKRAYRDTHPHLTRLQPRSQTQSIVHRAIHVVNPPSSSSSSSGIQLVPRGAPQDLEAQLYEEDDFHLAPECKIWTNDLDSRWTV